MKTHFTFGQPLHGGFVRTACNPWSGWRISLYNELQFTRNASKVTCVGCQQGLAKQVRNALTK